jgi:DNA-binding transcriptional regulator YhcF (GntR family)
METKKKAQFVAISHDMIDKICNEDLKASEIKTLLQILKMTNTSTGICYPSLDCLANNAHVERRTVISAVKTLVDKAFIFYKKGGRSFDKGNQANEYSIPAVLKANIKAVAAIAEAEDFDTEEFRRQLAAGELK